MDSITKLLNTTKKLVMYLKKSGLASLLLSAVIQECSTRWNTKLAVLIKFCRN